MAEHICLNCDTAFVGHFCNNCGQKVAHRLDFKHILHEVTHVFTHADKGIFSFVPRILARPGYVAKDYVEGRRKRHFNPFQYLIIITGISVFVVVNTHFMENTIKTINAQGLDQPTLMAQQKVVAMIQKYFNVMILLLLPVFSFFAWLFFRKQRYNYAEHLVLQACIQSQQNTISIFTFLIIYLIDPLKHGWVLLIPISILLLTLTLGYKQFFQISWLRAFIKMIVIYVCTMIVMYAFILAIIIYLWAKYKAAQ